MGKKVQSDQEADLAFAGFLGEGAVFRGDLTLEGDYRVDGHVYGNVTSSAAIVVGPHGEIASDELRAETVRVGGLVSGTLVIGARLEIQPGGRVTGRVVMNKAGLVVAPGGQFDGALDMPDGTA